MTVTIGRRELLATLGGAAAAWPLAARAQQPALPVIGYLSALSESQIPNLIEALRRGLSENGFVEGTSVIIDYRFAEGEYGRLQTFATEFVRRPVSLIVAVGPRFLCLRGERQCRCRAVHIHDCRTRGPQVDYLGATDAHAHRRESIPAGNHCCYCAAGAPHCFVKINA